MPVPVLIVECIYCASPWLLDFARKREERAEPVEWGAHPACEEAARRARFPEGPPMRQREQ